MQRKKDETGSTAPEVPTHESNAELFSSAYSQYAQTLRKFPSPELLATFTEERSKLDVAAGMSGNQANPVLLTESEKKHITGRKTWSDAVSEIDRVNAEYIKAESVDAKIINRLSRLGYSRDAAKIYHDCVEYLKNTSTIVVTFRAGILFEGLKNFQLLNTHEKFGTFTYSLLIGGQTTNFVIQNPNPPRDQTEDFLFRNINPQIRGLMANNIHARPRYGALIPGGKKIEPIPLYGQSYIVLQDIVKLNSLFCPFDSLGTFIVGDHNWMPCSWHNLRLLLLYVRDDLLHALAKRVTSGELSPYFDYIEVLLPAINILDSNLIKYIYINPIEYNLTAEEMNACKRVGITVSNQPIDYPVSGLNSRAIPDIFFNKFKTALADYITAQLKRLPKQSEKYTLFRKKFDELDGFKDNSDLPKIYLYSEEVKKIAEMRTDRGVIGFFKATWARNPTTMREFNKYISPFCMSAKS